MYYYPCSPPPLVPYASLVPSTETACNQRTPFVLPEQRPSINSPLWISFVHGNISRCNGCKGKIGRIGKRPLPPPDDIVFRHREKVLFQNPNTGNFQVSREYRNVYYHAWKTCVAAHFTDFNSRVHIKVDEVKDRLSSVHTEHIAKEFNVNI